MQEYAAGAKVSELCRKHGMSDATLYKWKAKYGGLQVSELRRLKDLESENAELKRLLADAMLDNAGLKGLLAKKLLTPAHRRDAVKRLMEEHQFSERRACRLVGISRSSLAYQARPERHARLRERLITLSGKHGRYGYPHAARKARPREFPRERQGGRADLPRRTARPCAHCSRRRMMAHKRRTGSTCEWP
ncbi:MAG: transposase [Pseudomonadota bacterium]